MGTPLRSEDVRAIVQMQLNQLQSRVLLATRGRCTLECDRSVIDHVLRVGSGNQHGARSIKRILQSSVAVPVAKLLLVTPLRTSPAPCRLHVEIENDPLAARICPNSRM